ncbi:MAG: hypothetical protein AVDCRST_MAG04-320, partial [uncultured Acetobacteraceae bacterium]
AAPPVRLPLLRRGRRGVRPARGHPRGASGPWPCGPGPGRGAGPGRGRRPAALVHPARADRRNLRWRVLGRGALRPRRAPPARLGVPRPLHGGGDAHGPAPLRRAAHGGAAARRDRGLPGGQRLPRAGNQRGAGAGFAARVARQPAHVRHGRGRAVAGARLDRHGALGRGDAGGWRRALPQGRLRAPGLRPGAALV